MSLKIGIVGLPNVGKSTLFNSLTGRSVPAENYPFCTIDPAVGIVPVPDPRLGALSRLSRSEKTIPAVVEFTDIAGLVKGASSGEGLGNQFLAHIREADAIAEVVRVFADTNVHHVHGGVNPLHDIEVIGLELVLADFEMASKRRAGLKKELSSGDKNARTEAGALDKLTEAFDAGKFAASVPLTKEEKTAVKPLSFLTMKPVLYVLNTRGMEIPRDVLHFLEEERAHWVALDIRTEAELAELAAEELDELRRALGAEEGGLDLLIAKSYELLGLATFFTTGPAETRGWTIRRGVAAPEAGAAIHSDFRDKFIRAEVIHWKDLVDAGSHAKARERGLVRTEGKGYVVQDGDVVEFKI